MPFMDDGVLPFPKEELVALGPGDDPDKFLTHTEWNQTMEAMLDVRDHVLDLEAAPGLTDGDKGDITVSASGATWQINANAVGSNEIAADAVGSSEIAAGAVGTPELADDAVTVGKLAEMAANTIIANLTGGAANPTHATIAALSAVIAGLLFAGAGQFGSGLDGTANFDGSSAVTGWTRSGTRYFPTSRPSWYYTTITLGNGVVLDMVVGGEGTANGCSAELHVNVEISIPSGSATIKLNGATPTTNVQATSMTTGHFGTTVQQGAGGIQNAGQNPGTFAGNWFNAFKSGAGGFGGASLTAAGSTVGGVAATTLADSVGLPCTWEQAKLGRLNIANPGAMSGGGGGGSGAGTVGIASGGAGGNGGGYLVVSARKITGNLTIQAKGGDGAPGVDALGSNTGGGSGGGGGVAVLGYGGASLPGTVTLQAQGGTGGIPRGGGTAGGNGVDGQTMFFPLAPS